MRLMESHFGLPSKRHKMAFVVVIVQINALFRFVCYIPLKSGLINFYLHFGELLSIILRCVHTFLFV